MNRRRVSRLSVSFGAALLLVSLTSAATSARTLNLAADNCHGICASLGDQGGGRRRQGRRADACPEDRPGDPLDRAPPRLAREASHLDRAMIPVAFHVIMRGDTYDDGNIPRSQIDAQIDVLNDSYSGRTGGARHAVPLRARQRRPHQNNGWFNARPRHGGETRDEGGAPRRRRRHAQHLHRDSSAAPARLGDLPVELRVATR